DAAGAFLSSQYNQCAYAAKLGLERTFDAYAALLGETNPNSKWRLARANRLGRDELSLLRTLLQPWFEACEIISAAMLSKLGSAIFAVMYRLARGRFPSSVPALSPVKRLELLGTQTIVFNADTTFAPCEVSNFGGTT